MNDGRVPPTEIAPAPGAPSVSSVQDRFLDRNLGILSVFAGAVLLLGYVIFVWNAYVDWRATSARSAPAYQVHDVIKAAIAKSSDTADLASTARIALEADALAQRTEHVRGAIALRGVMRFTSIMIGAVVAIVGAVFVLARVTADRNAEIASVAGGGNTLTLNTSFPGVILVLLGAILIAIPNVIPQRIDWNDANLYLDPSSTPAPGPLPGEASSGKAPADIQHLLKDLKPK